MPQPPALHDDEQLAKVWIDDEGTTAFVPKEFELATRLAEQAKADEASICPTHRRPWSYREGGISKTTGKAFDGFWSCSAPKDAAGFCKLRPSISWVRAQGAPR